MAHFVELKRTDGVKCSVNPDLIIALIDNGDETIIHFAGSESFAITVIGNIRKISHQLKNVK